MKIITLTCENVKRIRAVSITPDGAVVQITGRNGQGKTSVMDSIAYAIGGKEEFCDVPVRRGEKKAKVVVCLDDLIVTRTFTEAGGTALTVTNAQGAKYPSPQAVLDQLVGKLALDPLAFCRMPAKQQLETLRGVVGLDFSELDEERSHAFAKRTEVNRLAAAVAARLASAPHHADTPAEEVSVSQLAEEFARRSEVNAANARARQDSADVDRRLAELRKARTEAYTSEAAIITKGDAALKEVDAELERRIQELRKEHAARRLNNQAHFIQQAKDLEAAVAKLEEDEARCEDMKASFAANLIPADLDLQEVSQQMTSADTVNRKVRENTAWQQLKTESDELHENARQLTEVVEVVDGEKARRLAEAKFPVQGLSFTDSGVVFNSLPFNQASAAEQLRASVAIGLAMNPKLRVLLVRDGSLLDSDGLRILGELAEEHDAQVWLERVDDTAGVGVVIEDGMVAVHQEV